MNVIGARSSCGFLGFVGLLSNETEKRGAAQAYHSFIQLPTAYKYPQKKNQSQLNNSTLVNGPLMV